MGYVVLLLETRRCAWPFLAGTLGGEDRDKRRGNKRKFGRRPNADTDAVLHRSGFEGEV
jgi:hypothetical protein